MLNLAVVAAALAGCQRVPPDAVSEGTAGALLQPLGNAASPLYSRVYYVAQPEELGPRSTANFVTLLRDTSGGPGASFLVDWSSPGDVDPPVIESVMLGQHNNVGISFISVGRPLPKASAQPR